MIIKAIWISIMFISIFGFLFVSSFGIPIEEAFYETEEVIVLGYE